jgi:hypothetical protein
VFFWGTENLPGSNNRQINHVINGTARCIISECKITISKYTLNQAKASKTASQDERLIFARR